MTDFFWNCIGLGAGTFMVLAGITILRANWHINR